MPEGIGVPFPPPPEHDPFIPSFPPTKGPPPIREPEPAPAPEPEPGPVPAPPIVPPPRTTGVPQAIPDISVLAILLLVLGLIAAVEGIKEFLNWLFQRMFGAILPSRRTPQLETKDILQPLSNALGKVEAKVDAAIGVSFAKLGGIVGMVGQAIIASELTTYQVAVKLGGLSSLQRQQGAVQTQTQQQLAAQKAAAQAGLQAAQTTQQAQALQLAAQATQIKTLQHHITHLIEPELDGLRHAIPNLERGATTAWDEIKKHEELLGAAGVTAATAFGLSQLGGDWIRCEASKLLGRGLCRSGPDIWKQLLAGAIDVLALSDICDLSAAVVATAQTLRPGMEAFVSVENALIGCHGNTAPHDFTLSPFSPTPVYAPVTI